MGSDKTILCPPVATRASPRRMLSVPKVVMMELMPMTLMMNPFKSPTERPDKLDARMASNGEREAFTRHNPRMELEMPTAAPRERSRPPENITTLSATTRIPRTATATPMLDRFVTDRKTGERMDRAAKMTR